MSSTGWNREYEDHQAEYITIFDNVMRMEKQEGDISFLEESIAMKTGKDYAVAVNSGTAALFFALKARSIGRGDQVLVSNFSWHSSATCVVMAGATPVFCDIDLDTYHMSIESIKRMTDSRLGHDRTRAIVYPHLFGNMSDTTEIRAHCLEHDILFIEDACQSIGAGFDGAVAGSIGDISTMSFNANKNIAGIAGGGAVMTNDRHEAEYIKKIRQHGNGHFLGYNSKMQLLNATIINHRLCGYMDAWQVRRNKLAKMYHIGLQDLPLIVQDDPEVEHNYHKYVVRFEDKETRDRMQKILGAAVHYDKPISENDMWRLVYTTFQDNYPNAKLASDTVLTLPLNHYTTDSEIHKTIELMWKNI
jgi:dTDP-4-amino-4,6-dideoxygalactose transaminase